MGERLGGSPSSRPLVAVPSEVKFWGSGDGEAAAEVTWWTITQVVACVCVPVLVP